ncbi:glutamate receptor ionotropic, kainate 2-like [Anticarsia gemmatalis]|uniref:glutamate receptor ionotropic, kainate 2-like n=1 Tax=Anticarsia gemmatalis TaxID=129554 RepID=UPI003F76FED8
MITLKALLVVTAAVYIENSHAFISTSYPIGGLFNRLSLDSSVIAFEEMIHMLSGTCHGEPLRAQVIDGYSTSLELCTYTSDHKGIVSLIDSRPTQGICDTTCLLCNRLNVSHLSLGWELAETYATDLYTFYYHPPPKLISTAYAALIKKLQWDKFTFLYEDDSSFIRLQEVINTWPSMAEPILFRKLDPTSDNRETFKHILKVLHISYHVIDCHVDRIKKYMEEIIQVDNSTEYQSFILTNLNSYTHDFRAMKDLMANVSTLHLTLSNDVKWKDMGMDTVQQLETALAADALNHIEKAIRNMPVSNPLPDPPALCVREGSDYSDIVWPLGADLRKALIETQTRGFTGNIVFDEKDGTRINFKLHYSKLNRESEFVLAGDWDSNTNFITVHNEVVDRSNAVKSNSKIRVAARIARPYFYESSNPNEPTVYKGYAVDLIQAIFERINEAEKLNLEYEIYPVPGNGYGNPVSGTKKWDGIIGELLDHKAELAICDLTITSERNAVVDFSLPFMSLGISMLFKEPEPDEPDKFSFLNPLSLDVWLYLATTYVIVSFVLLICARMCQDDWVNPHPCNQNPESLENIWSLYNCMWLTMGAIMTQGCDILPRAAGSRWVTGVWWFFALIVTASYTANMSTFLSNSRRSSDIKNVKDLADQNQISYGAVLNGSTYRFFQNSNDSVYSKIWTTMISTKPTVFTKDNDEGKERVIRSKGKYAFFMESVAIEYFINRDCDLKMVGSKLDSKEYGIAMPKNYPRKGMVDNAILYLQEKGKLEVMKNKWWIKEDNNKTCEDSADEEDNSGSLQMKNTSGIFLVLGMGGILGLIVAIIDFMLHARQISVKEKVTFLEALASEWRASLNPRELHKPTAPPRSAPPSTASPSPSRRERSQSRAVSVLRAATSFINFDEIY